MIEPAGGEHEEVEIERCEGRDVDPAGERPLSGRDSAFPNSRGRAEDLFESLSWFL